jgi:hypothetical protein
MTHIRGRHTIVGTLESMAGGLVVAATLQKMWWLLGVAILLGGAAIALDRFNIDDEVSEQIHDK